MKSFRFFVNFGVNLRHFHLETAINSSKKPTGQHIFTFLTIFKFKSTKSVTNLNKMHKFFANWKVCGFLSYSVLICDTFTQKTEINASEKPTGLHILSLLTLFNVPIHKVCRKFETNCIKSLRIGQFGDFCRL